MAFCNKTRGTGKKPKTPSPMTTRVVLLFVVLVIVPFFIMAAFVVRFSGITTSRLLEHPLWIPCHRWAIRYPGGAKKPHGELTFCLL